jgi:hypothetical protein
MPRTRNAEYTARIAGIRCTPTQQKRYNDLGGAKWLRQMLERYETFKREQEQGKQAK